LGFLTILLIALILSVDTFAASVSYGISKSSIRFKKALPIAFIFALFQGGLTFAGYFSGELLYNLIESFKYWIALGILLFLGGKMIIEGIRDSKTKKPSSIVALAIATSIDAFSVGFGFNLLKINIWTTSLLIGATTFLASMIGIKLGKGLIGGIQKIAEIAGGIILIILGIKIFLDGNR
jgi:manganese efflux pump family protein